MGYTLMNGNLSFQPLPLWLSFLLKEKKQKFKTKATLPPTGKTPRPATLCRGQRFFVLRHAELVSASHQMGNEYVGYLSLGIANAMFFFFSRLFVFIGAQEGFAVCLDTKRNKKIKAKGMLPPALPVLTLFSLDL
jgi:hypothetical protein